MLTYKNCTCNYMSYITVKATLSTHASPLISLIKETVWVVIVIINFTIFIISVVAIYVKYISTVYTTVY